MLSIGTNKLNKKIEAMQDTVFILEIQINTKAIQNCNEMKKYHRNDKFLQSFRLKIV